VRYLLREGLVHDDAAAARAAPARLTRTLARRQQSWFGRDPRVRWLDAPVDGPSHDLTAAALRLTRREPR
jgi:tRNA dimethylallyltransferase